MEWGVQGTNAVNVPLKMYPRASCLSCSLRCRWCVLVFVRPTSQIPLALQGNASTSATLNLELTFVLVRFTGLFSSSFRFFSCSVLLASTVVCSYNGRSPCLPAAVPASMAPNINVASRFANTSARCVLNKKKRQATRGPHRKEPVRIVWSEKGSGLKPPAVTQGLGEAAGL